MNSIYGSGQTDIVMGNVTPLKKRIAELEARLDGYEVYLLHEGIDIRKEYVTNTVEGDRTSEKWYGGDV